MPAASLRSATTVCTCLALRKASRRVSLIYDRCLAPYDLTITQYGLLAHVNTLDGIGIASLAENLVMDPTTLSRNLRPLINAKLAVLASDPHDRRNRSIHLTDAGRECLAKARTGWEAAQKQVATALGEKDGTALATCVDRLLEKLSG